MHFRRKDRATAVGNVRMTFGEDRTCSSGDIQTDNQPRTNRHGHHNTLLPYRQRSIDAILGLRKSTINHAINR